MIDIVVGPTEKIFCVHETLLYAKVDYFKKMLESGFAESVDQRATLPEDGVNVFALLLMAGNQDLATDMIRTWCDRIIDKGENPLESKCRFHVHASAQLCEHKGEVF